MRMVQRPSLYKEWLVKPGAWWLPVRLTNREYRGKVQHNHCHSLAHALTRSLTLGSTFPTNVRTKDGLLVIVIRTLFIQETVAEMWLFRNTLQLISVDRLVVATLLSLFLEKQSKGDNNL